jgi:NADPH2:quinone reductase
LKAIVIHKHGGPEVLQVEELPIPTPQSGAVLVKNQAIGINFVDVQHRAGLNYPVDLPLIPGTEAAGIVEDVGSGVTEFKVGDRVGYAGYMGGNYAEYTVVPEARLVPVPANVSFELAAASLLSGMTAHCLSQSVYPIQEGDVVLIHGGAGGVGLFLVQMAKARGATVITTVSTPEKAQRVREAGADHIILYTQTDFEAETMRLTQGEGVRAVYDSVGRTTFDKGLKVLKAQGYMVVFGLSSGPIPPFDINRLSGITGSDNKGSLFLVWPTLSDYAVNREDLVWRAKDVLSWIAEGSLQVRIARRLPLIQVAEAHRLLESRQVAGKIVVFP